MTPLFGSWPLTALNQFDGEKWIKTQNKNGTDLQLTLQGDSIYITHGTLVEQFCLSSGRNISVTFCNDILGFVVQRPQGISRLNVKFSPRCKNIADCIKYIQTFVSVEMINQDSGSQSTSLKSVVENVMKKGPLTYLKGNTNMVPENYPTEQIVQMCLLDSELPHFVSEVESLLHQYIDD